MGEASTERGGEPPQSITLAEVFLNPFWKMPNENIIFERKGSSIHVDFWLRFSFSQKKLRASSELYKSRRSK
ncbi:hypothetical protein POVWA2_019130 [Plasmodium ovale wallikeri]|uniref:Uncharacterized protein n=1 Tax=Plasmodium ovale wallikeri TaxID=864142 RepID=A0A1A8YVG2_PLAOA|nr:hypothetical protein POVWA2_019130 [Plasmodium ovale wallikeri]SBT35523.1 hypothetical protein POVWA1_027760 [Plasmodium ovale wallikeri]